MNDSFMIALNAQKATNNWMGAITENLANIYTPGYKEKKISFQTFLNGSVLDNSSINFGQGKSTPGTSNANLFLEGEGFFMIKNNDGKTIYTRHGEFEFDSEGAYKTKDGLNVQGYILNDKGEIMAGTKAIKNDVYQETTLKGGAMDLPTTNIKLWIDPNNGKYLGKYDDYEIKEDGTIYGKADGGKRKVPLYKVAQASFHNKNGLYEIKDHQYIETAESGKPVMGRAEVRSGLLELSNAGFKDNINSFQLAKVQMELANKLISSNKELLQEALRLVGSS
ncbi:flagellar hook basal-body protein [bacterium]|nr:flagellar hook basal-body protein [bacterium]